MLATPTNAIRIIIIALFMVISVCRNSKISSVDKTSASSVIFATFVIMLGVTMEHPAVLWRCSWNFRLSSTIDNCVLKFHVSRA